MFKMKHMYGPELSIFIFQSVMMMLKAKPLLQGFQAL